MGRSPCCSKEGLNRGAWTAMEDKILTEYMKIHGEGKWRNLPKRAGLKRCGKSCRLRWLNYLRPDIKRGNITHDEEELIIRLHKLLGNRWSLIAGRLPGRTDNEIKNYWNTNIGKKIQSGKPSNQSQGKPNPTIDEKPDGEPKVNTGGPCVVRTKATRCTKVVLTSEPVVGLGPSMVLDPVNDNKAMWSESVSKFNVEENNNPSNFMLDFQMDADFLSDFLNMDFSQLSYLEDNGCDPSHSSPKSNPPLLVSEDSDLHGNSDFQPMVSLIESELDWL